MRGFRVFMRPFRFAPRPGHGFYLQGFSAERDLLQTLLGGEFAARPQGYKRNRVGWSLHVYRLVPAAQASPLFGQPCR